MEVFNENWFQNRIELLEYNIAVFRLQWSLTTPSGDANLIYEQLNY